MTTIAPTPTLAAFLRRFMPPVVRPATPDERATLLQGDEGFVLIERGAIAGHVAFNERSGEFYGHSLVNWGGATGAAKLVQRARKEAKKRGYSSVLYHVQAPNLDMLRLVGRSVQIESAVLRMEVK